MRMTPLLLSGLVQLAVTACTSPASRWHVDVALVAGEKLGGCAVGNVLPDQPGPELVAVAGSGNVYVAWRDKDGRWQSERVYKAPGEVIQCAAGDVDPTSPGDEIVAVGMAMGTEDSGGTGAAYLVRRDGGIFKGEKIFEDAHLLHGTCITKDGIFAAGFSNKVFQLTRAADGSWTSRSVADLPGAGKNLVETKAGLAIACSDGSLVLLQKSRDGGGTWSTRVLDKRSQGRARVGTDGERVVVADDDGTLSIVSASGRKEIHKESQKLRGAILAELDPASPGLEAACAGYEHKITVLGGGSGGWHELFTHVEPDRLHHLVAVDLDGKPGLELVACGYAGRLVVLGKR
jgi:hypothetical protein